MGVVELEDVVVDYDGRLVLDGVSFRVGDGELVALVGPSGSGKTTVLRVLAGLTAVAAGAVRIGGVDVTRSPPAKRDLGMVFQNPALFPHLNVRRNVALPLEFRREHVDEIRRRVSAETRAMHIEHLLLQRPSELSRGEAQLVQIARALVRAPGLLLLDEPFESLDVELRLRTRTEIGLLQRGYGVTTVMTTNDPSDLASLPDRLVVLERGRVVQVDAVEVVHRHPATLNAAMATGALSTISVTVRADGRRLWLVRHRDDGTVVVAVDALTPALADRIGEEVVLGIRPEDATVDRSGQIRGTVERLVPGSDPMVWCDVGGQTVALPPPDRPLRAGEAVTIRIDHTTLYDPTSGHSIE